MTHVAPVGEARLVFGASDAPDPIGLDRLRGHAKPSMSADRLWRGSSQTSADTCVALRIGASVEPALRDCGFGSWTGRSLDAVAKDDAEGFASWCRSVDARPPGGESARNLIERVGEWIAVLSALHGHDLAIVHPLVARAALAFVLAGTDDTWFRISVGFATRSVLTRHGTRWQVALMNAPL